MIGGRQLVCVTPAGRARYMRELVPFILSESAVDRYDIWVNTTDPGDLAFLEALSGLPGVRLCPLPSGRFDGSASIHQFFSGCCEPDTVYVRIDDDVVFIEQGAIARLAAFRIAHPEYFLATPVVINNAVISCLLQVHGRIPATPELQPDCMDDWGWASPQFAEALWRLALARLAADRVGELHLPDLPLGINRFSINCISWLGERFAAFGGAVARDEEFDLTVRRPALAGAGHGLCGTAVVGHFAFHPQRRRLDSVGLLARIARQNDSLAYVDQSVRARIAGFAEAAAARFPAPPARSPSLRQRAMALRARIRAQRHRRRFDFSHW